MKTITDPIFGEMSYNYSWEKQHRLDLWDKIYLIKIVANDIDENGISQTQRDTYNAVEECFSDIILKNSDKIKHYIHEAFEQNAIELSSALSPRSIVFQRDGSWGILFDCAYDEDHGIALYFIDQKAHVGSQDAFL